MTCCCALPPSLGELICPAGSMLYARAFFHFLLRHLRSKAAPCLEALGPRARALPPVIAEIICEEAADPRDVNLIHVLDDWCDIPVPCQFESGGSRERKMTEDAKVKMECLKLTTNSSNHSVLETISRTEADYIEFRRPHRYHYQQ